MKNDIQSREDLFIIVADFYRLLFNNDILQEFFIEFREEQALNHHLDTLVDFWDNTLFYSGSYKKNAMKPHIILNEKTPLSELHFKNWITLFNEAVDNNFKGMNAETMKNRALSIATVMKLKFGIK